MFGITRMSGLHAGLASAVVALTALMFSINAHAQTQAQSNAPKTGKAAMKTIEEAERLYEKGEFEKAYPQLVRLARNGGVEAQFMLSKMYADGKGVKADAPTSLRYLRQAATLSYKRTPFKWGHPEAQYMLGKRYANGEGVTKNAGSALNYFQRAAAQGHSGAMAELPAYYAGEKGVKANAQKGYEWSGIGARFLDGSGQESAKKYQVSFAEKISKRKAAQLDTRIAAWEPRRD
jgi:TPR repeat protein